MSSLSFPEPFLARITEQLGSEVAPFLAALALPPQTAVRRNRRKPAVPFPGAETVPWCPSAVYLPERPVFARDPLWHAGAYYVQEPASLLLDVALRTHATASRRALDLCAAPGGKTTLLADFLPDDALLVANEVIRSRERILSENVVRWGWPNITVTNHDPTDFAYLSGFFDLVVVDAPCSGEGLFRKEPEAVREWSEKTVTLCTARQERILAAAESLVCPGGLLIYSTCTYNPAENDATIARRLQTGEWERLSLPLSAAWGIQATEYGYQCWPHRCRGEGFYLSVLRRTGEPIPALIFSVPPSVAVPEAVRSLLAHPDRYLFRQDARTGGYTTVPAVIAAEMTQVERALFRSKSGIPVAIIKGKDLLPAHELAVSTAAAPDLPGIAVDQETALAYLRKNPVTVPDDTAKGWQLIRYQGVGLGWIKALGDRVNNYLPNELRLRLT